MTTTITTTTTTKTTTLPPLFNVQTLYLEDINGHFVEKQIVNASNLNETSGNLSVQSINYGTLAPGEISQNIIIKLKVSNVKAINNIKLGLINTGGITFANNIFGIISLPYIAKGVHINEYFNGISDGTSTSIYNKPINNLDLNSSYYVYLNLHLPHNNFLGEGVIQLQWFFDYDD